jgi:hypothetical protein
MWQVEFDDHFATKFGKLPLKVRKAIAAYAILLESEGPHLACPHADTLKGSSHANMKELRPTVDKVEWRVAYAFDPRRRAILLAAAAKGGKKTAYKGQRIWRP